MEKAEQLALKKISESGYIVHYATGMYKSSVGSGRIFEATEDWISGDRYNKPEYFDVGDLIYQDDTYIELKLSRASIHDFRIYQKLDTEKMVKKFIEKVDER